MQNATYGRYLQMTLRPSGLSVFHPYPSWIEPAKLAFSCGVLLLATGLAVALRRKRPYVIVAWLWYVGMLVPVIGLVQVGSQAMADRYLPMIGLGTLMAWRIRDLASRRSWAGRIAVAGRPAVR